MTRLHTFRHDGLTFDVKDAGPADGEVVVLLHGFPERAGSWDQVAARLHERGYRTLAPDQRGYSPGARPRRRSAYRITRLVADIKVLIHRVGGPVHVVGHDWGAVVGWALAAQRPDLVRTLTAVSVGHPMAFVSACRTGRQLRRSWYLFLFVLPFLPELLARHRPARWERALRGGGMRAEDVARFRREIVADGALPGALGWYRALPYAPPRWFRRRVRVPTTHVWSDGDVAVDRRTAELTARWVPAPYELVILEGVTHWIPVQAPDPLADAILARIASVS